VALIPADLVNEADAQLSDLVGAAYDAHGASLRAGLLQALANALDLWIDGGTGLSGTLPGIGASGVQATTSEFDPSVDDDEAAIGDTWVNTSNGAVWTCASNATGAAVWLATAPWHWQRRVSVDFALTPDGGAVDFDASDYVGDGVWSGANSDWTCPSDGIYEVHAHGSIECSPVGTTRSGWTWELRRNSGGGFATVSGGDEAGYQRGYTSNADTYSFTLRIGLSSGDKLHVWSRRLSGTDDSFVRAGSAAFWVRKVTS